MFLTAETTYNHSGQQVSWGLFLALIQVRMAGEPRAFTCWLSMEQVGHFMMGPHHVCGGGRVFSGRFGGDGMPKMVAEYDDIWTKAAPLPEPIRKAYQSGNLEALREWAKSLPVIDPRCPMCQQEIEDDDGYTADDTTRWCSERCFDTFMDNLFAEGEE
jgi:hypothetical protein